MKKIVRQKYKNFYKKKRREDGKEVGRQLDDLIQVLHQQDKFKPQNRDPVLISDTLAEITEIRKEKRFREDFPSFSQFKKFLKKEKLKWADLQEL